MVSHRPVGARVLHEEEIQRRDLAVLGESDSCTTRHVRARAADVALFLAADAHHHRRIRLLREQRGYRHRYRTRAFAPEPATSELADQNDVGGSDADPSRDAGHRGCDALRRPMQIQFPVLPVRHGAAGLHGVVTRGLDHECFVEHEIGLREAALEIAERPFLERAPHWQPTAALVVGEIFLGPLHGFELGRSGTLCTGGRRLRRCPDVASASRVGASRAKAVERIHDEGKRCEVDTDGFNRCGG